MELSPIPKCAFTGWKYRDRFDLIDGNGNNIKVQCKLCLPTINILSTSKSSTSNLKKHLMRKHHDGPMKEDISNDEFSFVIKEEPEIYSPPPTKKQHIQVHESISQSTLNQLLLEFSIECTESFNLVEHPSFVKLIETLSGGKSVMSQQNLLFNIENAFGEMKKNIQFILRDVHNLCSSIDMWSVDHKTYLCFSVYWIDEKSLRRKSAALSLKRIKGPNNYKQISSIVNEILTDYKINEKLSSIVTNLNCQIGHRFPEFEELSLRDIDKEFKFLDAGVILASKEKDDPQFNLPTAQTCTLHTLNSVATKVIDKMALQDPSELLYKKVRAKCASIWFKERESVIRLEALQDLISMKTFVPSVCQWISEYVVMAKLFEFGKEQLNEICNYLEVSDFSENEFLFLEEYIGAFQPLAQSIDVLQGDKRCYYGYIIPTVLSLKTKLVDKLPQSKLCGHILREVIKAIDENFGDLLKNQSAKIATMSLPKFRLCWASSEEEKSNLRREMNIEVSMFLPKSSQFSNSASYSDGDDSDEDFFVFGKESVGEKSASVSEVTRYLEDNVKTIDYLHTTPMIKELFIKYNTTIPSCTSHERLLNYEGRPLSILRSKISDEQMEWCLLLRYNKRLCS